MTVVSLTYNSDWLAGLNPLGLRSEQRAISSTARQLEEQWVDALDYQTTVSIGERWNRLVTAIQDVADEASEPDWDGHGALQANEMAVRWAFQFALSLPRDLPLPQPSMPHLAQRQALLRPHPLLRESSVQVPRSPTPPSRHVQRWTHRHSRQRP